MKVNGVDLVNRRTLMRNIRQSFYLFLYVLYIIYDTRSFTTVRIRSMPSQITLNANTVYLMMYVTHSVQR